ncbi:MAG: tetratricopeptide repeat protein [Ignavibacteria bacterium]
MAEICRAQQGDIHNRFLLAQSYEQSGDLKKAALIYEDIYKWQPDNYLFFDALNRIYIQFKNYDSSIAITERRLKKSPQDINMYGLLGGSYYLKGDEKKAFEVWDEALNVLPDKQTVYRLIASYAIEKRAFEKASDILLRGKKLTQDNFNFSYDLANIYSVLMKYREAADEYCQILLKDPAQFQFILTRFSTYMNKADAQKLTIETVASWAKKTNDQNILALLGWLYVESGHYDEAYEAYAKIDGIKKNGGGDLYNFAERAFRDSEFDIASDAFKKILDDYPASPFAPSAKMGYAKTLEASLNNKYEKQGDTWKPFFQTRGTINQDREEYLNVLSAYAELIKDYPGNEVAFESAYRTGLIKMERFSDIDGAAEAFHKVVDNSRMTGFAVPSYAKLAEIAIVKGAFAQAQNYYDMILENPQPASQDKNFSVFMKARIFFWNGDFSGASGMLKDVEINYNENHTNDAIELSLLINTTKNDSLSLSRFALAELMSYQKKFMAASEIYAKLSRNENLFTIRDLSALRYAEMILALDDLQSAIALLSAIAVQSEKNIYADKSLFLLGQVYQYGFKDTIKAIESYENLLAKFPNSLYLDGARENINELKNKPSKNL